jgi:hypothetical protein
LVEVVGQSSCERAEALCISVDLVEDSVKETLRSSTIGGAIKSTRNSLHDICRVAWNASSSCGGTKLVPLVLPCEFNSDDVGTLGGDVGQACGRVTRTTIVLHAEVEDTPGGGVHEPKWS